MLAEWKDEEKLTKIKRNIVYFNFCSHKVCIGAGYHSKVAYLGVPFVEFYGVFSYSPEVGVCCFSPRYCTSAILQICESTAEVARFTKKLGVCSCGS
jgi:hypothetical protein